VIRSALGVIAAKGFEKDTYFEQATRHIPHAAEAGGTVHVNLALVLSSYRPLLRQGLDRREVRTGAGAGSTPPTTASCSHRGRRAAVAHRLPGLESALRDSRSCRRRDLISQVQAFDN